MRRILSCCLLCCAFAFFLVGCNDSSTDAGSNASPVAAAGADQTATVGDALVLDGSLSSDPDNDALSYVWTISEKPSGSVAAIANGTSSSASFSPDMSGQYTIRLTVSDGEKSATDDIIILVEGVAGPTVLTDDILTATRLRNVYADPLAVDYILDGYVNVLAQLTIDPGVRIQAGQNALLTVEQNGAIIAVGTADSAIVFTGSVESAGTWYGLYILSNNPQNRFEYCQIGYGGNNSYANLYVGSSAQVAIRNCVLHHSLTCGMQIESGATITGFASNQFLNNTIAGISIPSELLGKLDAGSTFVGNNGKDVVQVYSNGVSTPQTWPKTDAPYYFENTLSIYSALTISAGAVLIMAEDTTIDIHTTGSLKAVGTATDSVIIRGEIAAAGYWNGMTFYSNDSNNVLQYVSISDGGTSSYANIWVSSGARLSITNTSSIRSGTWGILFEGETHVPAFANNRFAFNDYPVCIHSNNLRVLDSGSSYTGNTNDFIDVRANYVETDQTWEKLDVPCMVEGTLYIDAAVTIAPGAVYYFTADSGIYVNENGSLTAVGTAFDTIRFLGKSPTPGYWGGIVFNSNNTANQLSFTEVSHGGSGGYANIWVGYEARANMTDSSITDSLGWGIFIEDEAIVTMSGNTYANNTLGDVGTPN
jgi:hypothetical protein